MTSSTTPSTAEREFDVVLFGATGFTGRQTVAYFAQHAPGDVRWAIAGRDANRLGDVARAWGEPVRIVCDSHDPEAMAALARRTRVMLTTVGPYAVHGQALVEACVGASTHYVDITGETAWVRDLIDRFHDSAVSSATRIVPFCGFDSVPSDLGAWIAVDHLRSHHGTGCKRVRAFHRGRGGINGGTIASFLAMQESGDAARMRDPLLLNPPGLRDASRPEAEADPTVPTWDAEVKAFAAPFIMGPINTRVVRRSAALAETWQAPYGSGFSYQEYWKGSGTLGLAETVGMAWSQAIFPLLAGFGPVRRLLKRMLPAPGSGPSEATMDSGFFRCELIAEGENGQRIRVTFADQGDPGNRATVKMLCESALALAVNADELPGAHQRGGILTPATAFGAILRRRLEGAGMTVRIDDPWNNA